MRLSLHVAGLLLSAGAVSAQTTPCTKAVTACERWLTWDGGPARSKIYGSYPLDVANRNITRALIMVHGAGRNADHYFETAMAAGFLAGALDNTIILAPRFAAGTDTVAANEILWPERGENWRSGGASPTLKTATSFGLVDELIRQLADKKVFPNLTKIVVTGHSAGGQFATRYEMTSKAYNTPGVSIMYVVANPSSYAWPAAVRPLPVGGADSVTAHNEAVVLGEKLGTNYQYGPFDSTKAPSFNRWPSGLENRTGYAAGPSDQELIKQLVERPTTYLLGQVDVLPLGGFDKSANAMAQGPTRRARGEAFYKYVTETLGAKHQVIIVSECGHNDRCIFTTDTVFPAIFPK